MRKILSVLLVLTILFGSVSVVASASSNIDMAFAVASDLHIAVPEQQLTISTDNPLYPHANTRLSLQNESSFILKRFLEQCANDDNVEFVLVPGDLGNNGRMNPEEHKLTAKIFREFEQSTGKQIYVINGNHDIGVDLPYTYQMFKENYYEFGWDLALESREEDCSYTANLGNKYRLIALDSCGHDIKTADGLTEERIVWVLEQAEKATKDGRYPILMMHHNLLQHMPVESTILKAFIIGNHEDVAEKFANSGIHIVLTGHYHSSDVTTFISSKGNPVTDFCNTSLTSYPIEYRMFYMNEKEIKYESKTVDGIDTDALQAAVSGYSPEVISALNNDINEYSKGFFKESVEILAHTYLNAEILGITSGNPLYTLVSNVTGKLKDVLDMPLYGEDSIEEMGKKYNIEIPKTEYVTGYDAVCEVVTNHYAGSESYTYQTPEVLIFLRLLAIIFREEAQVISGKEYENSANEIFENSGDVIYKDKLTEMGEWAYGNITPLEYLILALVSPVIMGFLYDDDGVDDNNGILLGYGAIDSSVRTENITNNVMSTFNTLVKSLINFMYFLTRALGVEHGFNPVV